MSRMIFTAMSAGSLIAIGLGSAPAVAAQTSGAAMVNIPITMTTAMSANPKAKAAADRRKRAQRQQQMRQTQDALRAANDRVQQRQAGTRRTPPYNSQQRSVLSGSRAQLNSARSELVKRLNANQALLGERAALLESGRSTSPAGYTVPQLDQQIANSNASVARQQARVDRARLTHNGNKATFQRQILAQRTAQGIPPARANRGATPRVGQAPTPAQSAASQRPYSSALNPRSIYGPAPVLPGQAVNPLAGYTPAPVPPVGQGQAQTSAIYTAAPAQAQGQGQNVGIYAPAPPPPGVQNGAGLAQNAATATANAFVQPGTPWAQEF